MKVNVLTTSMSARLLAAMAAACILTGCGDFFAEKQTEVESMAVLKELSQVRESPHVKNPLPEIYRKPAERLAIKDGVKLFYFTQHHPAGNLADLLNQQLAIQSTVNPATNQIVAYCKDDKQADAALQYLQLVDVTPVQVNIDCLILERFGDITMDWETSLLVQNFLGEKITLGEKLGTFDNSGILTDLDPAFPGASLREVERGSFGLDFGYWMNRGVAGHQVRTIVDVLVSRGYLKILLNPQLETINGKKATVTIKDYAPIEEVKTGQGGASNVYNITKYVWVENTLAVTPHVFSDGSIGLTTRINIGSRSKPEGVVQRSIITERSIDVEENRIEPGKSLIIGGMRKSEKRSVVRGVPFLKDLPLVGILFSSKDFEEKGTEIIFILTPSISGGGVENAAMVADIRGKYEEPEYKASLAGPLGKDAFTQVLEKEAAQAELDRIQAQVDLEQAQTQAQAEKERADKMWQQAEQLRQQARQLTDKANNARKAAEEAVAEAEKIKSQTQADQEKVQAIEQKKSEALRQLQESQKQAQEAAEKARQAKENANRMAEQAKAAQKQLEKAQKTAQEKAKRQRQMQEQHQQREMDAIPQSDDTKSTEPDSPVDQGQ